jgi:hypothetical protein
VGKQRDFGGIKEMPLHSLKGGGKDPDFESKVQEDLEFSAYVYIHIHACVILDM